MLLAMSDSFWNGFFTSLPGVITALGAAAGVLWKMRSDRKAMEKKLDTNTEVSTTAATQATAAAETSADVKTIVNGEKAAMIAEIIRLKKKCGETS